MTVQTTFAANISASDARETLNSMLSRITALESGTTPAPSPSPTPSPSPSPSPSPTPPPSGSTTVYPVGNDLAVTADTGFRQTNSQKHTITTKLANVAPYKLWLASNADGSDAIVFDYVGFDNYKVYLVSGSTQTDLAAGQVSANNEPSLEFIRVAGGVKLLVGGVLITEQPDSTKTGTYARAQIGGGQTVTITAQA